jgi:gamma-glutamyl:cysteine ligase YbdK (ATP-grasp superfamily)
MPPRWESWERYIALTTAVTDVAAGDGSWFWWYTKPHATHGTVEVRVCDTQTDVRNAHALASLIGAVCTKLADGELGLGWIEDPVDLLLDETMWNATRLGVDGACLVSRTQMTLGEHALQLIDLVAEQLTDECVERLRQLALRSEATRQVEELAAFDDPFEVARSTSARSAGAGLDVTSHSTAPTTWKLLPQLDEIGLAAT